MMEIIPPELLTISRQRYFSDLRVREELDQEMQAERRDRLNLLFHPERIAPE